MSSKVCSRAVSEVADQKYQKKKLQKTVASNNFKIRIILLLFRHLFTGENVFWRMEINNCYTELTHENFAVFSHTLSQYSNKFFLL